VAGTGFITEGFIRKGLSVIAVDQSEAMLDQMRKKFSDFAGIEYRQGEARRLPIADEVVDYVLANMYLHHVESSSEAIQEIVRILKPRGKVVLTDLDEHTFAFLKVEHHDRWMGFQREAVRQWLVEVGLREVAVGCAGENCCAQLSCGCDFSQVNIFIASGEK